MIAVVMQGGLGNQLFQYAYYLSLKKLNPNKKSTYLHTANHTVALHVRRGDFLAYKNLYSVLGETSYYEKAIQYMRDKLGAPVFIVFSDDLDWCREHLPLDATACYVDWNRGKSSFRDMQLMSLCKHMIMANSTFSWWGAWLNTNPDKIIVSPEKWFVDRPTEAIIDVPREWVRI